MRTFSPCMLVFLLCFATVGGEEESSVLARRALKYETTCRVSGFTEKAETISSPVQWVPLVEVIEDGAAVTKGQTIARFDLEGPKFELEARQMEGDVVDAELRQRLSDIANKGRELGDQLEELEDKLAVLEARMRFQMSLPDPGDVEIAEGRLRVAVMNYQAARNDVERAERRFAGGLISPAELEAAQTDMQLQEAAKAYAERELSYTRLPATASTVKKTELQCENTRLEIAKLKNEIEEHKGIADIQRKGAQSRRDLIDQRIKEQQEEVDNTDVVAPITGYVSHNRAAELEGGLQVGAKMWRNFAFLRIPDMETLAFRGVLLETERRHFQEGDLAEVRLRGRMGEPINCRLKSISTLPHDLAEKEEGGWGSQEREYGVKVFDVVLEILDDIDWVRPGMVGEAEIVAARTTEGPAVPLRFVMFREGKTFLSFDGTYEAVTGVINQGLFVVDDAELEGRPVQMRGEFAEDANKSALESRQRLFSVSGELSPVASVDVVVRDVGRWPWPKVTWLIDEESEVKKGDVVAKLDTAEIEKRITTEETELRQAQSTMEELEKTRELTLREGEFNLATERNLLEISRLNLDLVLNGRDTLAIYKAMHTREQSQIRLASLDRRLEHENAKEVTSLSPVEMRQLTRDREREALRLERATIRLRQLEDGATAVERGQAQLDFLRQEQKVRVMERTSEYENRKSALEFERTQLHVKRHSGRLKRWQTRKENATITSPGDGMICYSRIWNSGVISKVNVGSTVGPRFVLLTIPDLSKMDIRVEIPERYCQRVTPGLAVDVSISSLSDLTLKGRVESIDLLFLNRQKKDSQMGMYSSREPLGEVVFTARVTVSSEKTALKPGAVAEVFFPFNAD